MYKPQIIVAGNEPKTQKLLTHILQGSQYRVRTATLSDLPSELRAGIPDAMIVDAEGADRECLELAGHLRGCLDGLVLILCPNSSSEYRTAILNSGADDCMEKPFSPDELLARLRSHFRRCLGGAASREGTFQGLGMEIDYGTGRVLVEGKVVALSPHEYALLCLLTRHAGTFLPESYLIQILWRGTPHPSESLHTCMSQLRKKLRSAGACLLTQTQAGYSYLP